MTGPDTPKHADESKITVNPFLGVRCSLMGQMWLEKPYIARMAAAISMHAGVPHIVGQLLAGRGINTDSAEEFLSPSIKDSMPDPNCVKDMEKAVVAIVNALQTKQNIAIYGDYDVDGATSSAVLYRYLTAVGADVQIYIPDRMREGYGPNISALLGLRDRGVDLLITVDCGTLSFEPLKAAKDAELDVIIVDHHKAETRLPEALAIINPNRLDDSSNLGQLAAVGVAFLLCVALNRALRNAGVFQHKQEPNLISLLDIVALGTICDVVPLTGLNRAYVSQGLKVMAERKNPGITALADVGRVSEAPGTYHAGFILGPRVNAGGRVGESSLGAKLLTTNSAMEASQIADKLDAYNEERKAIEAEVLNAAMADVERDYGHKLDNVGLIMIAREGWHAGVIGIVASRIKDKYGLPVFVIGIEGGEGKGSGRSISGVDLGSAVIEAASNGLLIKGGGHAMAAGLSVSPDKIDELREFLDGLLLNHTQKAREGQALKIDGAISLSGVTVRLIDDIEAVGPFGMGNPSPRFVIPDVALIKADTVGHDTGNGNHVRAIFKSKDGASIKAMAFRQSTSDLGLTLLSGLGRRFHIAGRLKKNTWGGYEKVEMTLDDAAIIGPP